MIKIEANKKEAEITIEGSVLDIVTELASIFDRLSKDPVLRPLCIATIDNLIDKSIADAFMRVKKPC